MKLDEARARFGEALDVCPDHPGAMMELERTFDPIDGPSEDDTATLRRAAKAHPDSIDVAMALTAALRQDREQQAEAIENCMKLCNRRLAGVPDDVDALIAKAQMYLWKRDLDAMERAARRAVALAPNSQHSLNYLALSLARQNRWEEAFPIYETIYGLDNKTVWAYISLRQMGTYLGFHEGDWERAAGVQEKVWDLTGRPHEAGNLIYFYGRAGQLDHARALFRKVRDFPHPARVYEVVAGAS